MEGHGTHTAGSAAGATLNDPAVTANCSSTEELGCIGECFNSSELESFIEDVSYPLDFHTWCPQHECDGYGEDYVPCMYEGNIPCTAVDMLRSYQFEQCDIAIVCCAPAYMEGGRLETHYQQHILFVGEEGGNAD